MLFLGILGMLKMLELGLLLLMLVFLLLLVFYFSSSSSIKCESSIINIPAIIDIIQLK